MNLSRSTIRDVYRGASALLLLAVLGRPLSIHGQDQSAEVVDVILNQSVSVPLSPVSHVVVVDDSICRVEIEAGTLRLFGLKRGETIVVVWKNDAPESLIVRVGAPPPAPTEKHLTTEELDAMGHGTIGALAHMGTTSRGARSLSVLTPFAWAEGTASGRFTMNGQVQATRSGDTSDLNLDTVSAQWTTGARTITLLDFAATLDGGAAARITPSSHVGSFALRGADLAMTDGKNAYEFFGGMTVPWFAASRQLAGVSVTRQQSERVYLDATTAAVSAPVLADATVVARQFNVFQTAGLTEWLNDRAAVQVRGGAGTSGVYGQAAASWHGERVSAYATGTGSSPQFGLNQLQLVYAPIVDVQTGTNWNVTRRLRTGLGYTHTATEATPLFPARSTSDYLSSAVSVALTRNHTLFANGVWNRNLGGLGLAGQLTGRRLDTGLSSQLGPKVANNVQLSAGALADPLQLASRSQFSVRDNLSVVTGRGSVSVSFSHDRLSPSLVARLREQLNLLAPSLQSLFLDDPVGFIESPQMPVEVRQLLASLEPVDTQVVVSGQFRLGPRLTINPTVSYLHNAQSSSLKTNHAMAGYALTWRATPTLEIQSTLSNALVFDPRQSDLARTTIFGIGLRKTLNGAPRWAAPSAGYRIRGRVFRDLNLDGATDQEEPGLAGVTIRLSTGRSVQTDQHGQFEFGGLSPGEYRVIMPLDQLGAGVRVTTPIDVVVRLYERRAAEVDFGVVNFSRLMGTVFNDLTLDGVRQADASGLREIAVVIHGEDAIEHRLITDAAGEFEVDDLAPGRYRVSVDGGTLPANYVAPEGSVDVDVAPSATVTVNMPVRALRSINGHVYLRTPGSPLPLAPLKGVKVTAHGLVAVTDEQGGFVLRDLPAGDVVVSVVPTSPVPADLGVPAGRLRMPAEPIQVANATIVIDNPRLIEYLVPGAVTSAPH
jgi:hypothetical protein